MKVALGIAYYRSMCVPTFASLWRVARSYKGQLDVLTEGSCYVHWNREELLEKALKGDYSHLWFVDTDVTFPPDTLDRLLAHDVDIVGGYYRVRQENPINSTLSINVGGILTPASPPFPDKLFCTVNGYDVMVIPTGCMLIRLSVVQKLKPPYFRCERPIGEDVFFCSWLWNAGIKIWCDPTIKIGHVGEKIYEADVSN